MSLRTILVGIFAALCGITATVGVNQIRSKPACEETSLVVARIDIKSGVEITPDMLTEVEWSATNIPPGAFTSSELVRGQFSTYSFVQNEPIIESKISPDPTFLQIPSGMRAVSIVTKTESSMVAGLVAPGNRVDLVWTVTKQNKYFEGPVTLTLLENVEVLAVGNVTEVQPKTFREFDPNKTSKSITILVTSSMAEEINLAEQMGVLNFTLRSTSEPEDTEPRQNVSIRTIFEDALAGNKTQPEKSEYVKALESEFINLKSMFESQIKKLAQLPEEPKSTNLRVEVPPGMRAVSIQTPDDSTGVAGLIQPGNRVDVLLTTNLLHFFVEAKLNARTITLIENVEVAAVGTHSQTDKTPEPKLAKSITLFVTPEMAKDINLGSEIGTLRLALRGEDENENREPRRMVVLTELIETAIAQLQPKEDEQAQDSSKDSSQNVIRVNRGGVNTDIPVNVSAPKRRPPTP